GPFFVRKAGFPPSASCGGRHSSAARSPSINRQNYAADKRRSDQAVLPVLFNPLNVVRLLVIILFSGVCCKAEEHAAGAPQSATNSDANQIHVNWLYGAFLPREVPLKPLTTHQRLQLYVRQTYTTWGIYAKTGFFALGDQASNSPPDWGDGFGG